MTEFMAYRGPGGFRPRAAARDAGVSQRAATLHAGRGDLDHRRRARGWPGRVDRETGGERAAGTGGGAGCGTDPARLSGLGGSLRGAVAGRLCLCDLGWAMPAAVLRTGSFWS